MHASHGAISPNRCQLPDRVGTTSRRFVRFTVHRTWLVRTASHSLNASLAIVVRPGTLGIGVVSRFHFGPPLRIDSLAE